jgi:serine/threonine protein kinase
LTSQCKKCGKSLVNTRAGSFTSYLFQQNYCQCNSSPPSVNGKATNASQVCANCGKSVAKKRAGSFTSFLFQELRCQCAQPALPKHVRLSRTNTQVRRQAMAEKRGYTANFKANAESGRKLPQADFSSGTVIGGVFKIDAVIGEGGMGIVYLAQHLSLNRAYALKVLSPSIVSEQSWLRFKAEAKTLSALNHPGLVKVYDLGIHENTVPYYSMDYLEGETLEELLVRNGPQKLEYTISIFLAVLDALAYAHRNNVVHRDIKPANIFICQNQEIKILDFGISKLVGDKQSQRNQELTVIGEVFGSPYYMSPEQCRGEQIDSRSDIYSVGCALFETLTGYIPFESDSSLEIAMLHEEGDVPLLSDVSEVTFPPSLDVVIEKCLAKLPQDRYQSAKELAIDLTRIKEGKNLAAYAGAGIVAARSNRSDSGGDQVDSMRLLGHTGLTGQGLIGYGLVVFAALSLIGVAVFVIVFQPIAPKVAPLADKTLLTVGQRNLPRMTDVAEELTGKGETSIDAKVKVFFAKPFKYYSQIVSTKGKEYRVFTFPAGVSLGKLHCTMGFGKVTYEATGTVSVPTKMRVALTGNALLQFQPKLLSYFRSDDLTSLALSNELTRVDLLLTEISRLTSLETLRLQRLLLNENSPRYINHLTKLNSLTLDECQIEPAVFEKLLPVTKVQTLVFDGGPKISPQLKVIARNRQLTSLTITSAVLSKDDLKTLASISSLETLCLKYCSLTNDDLKVLTKLSNLRDLDISFTKVDRNCIESLVKFRKLGRLVVSRLSPADEKALQSALPNLRLFE